ncbi:MAG: hydantoinase/oxoprolinase family protein [Alphaproteobacteria bacterium]|nr:hydantoinase/oxoprolinase family protein [Alphaproteobacteria bacterium]
MTKATRFRVGVDIGGTFTDIVFLGQDGTIHTKKISSSTGDYSTAIVDGLEEVFAEASLNGANVDEIRHGTTVASNAILEGKGAKVGLITTGGFRDVLELRTLRMPRLYDMAWQKPPPLVERYLRRTVKERIKASGEIEVALEPEDARAEVRALLAEGVDAIAVCLINSFTNPVHELMIKKIIEEEAPGMIRCISYEVLPEIKEYERTSTTVINGYVMPIVATYLKALRLGLDSADIPAQVLLMQSNGGLTTDSAAAERPINIIESGPAGGVVGAQAIARTKHLDKIITFDMGGTTAKASMVEDGNVLRAQEYAVGAGIMVGSRLLSGAGYTLKVPAIDLAEVGAGGGSLVRVDSGGAIQVGPESAGAVPGPVCYAMGGEVPTVTDANVVLGYLNPNHLVGGALPLDAGKAREAFLTQVAEPLGLSIEDAAHGAFRIAASNMIRAIRAVSSERGRDPREFSLFPFGGNGPLFACEMATALGMKRIVVPPAPGLFSSFGLLYADLEHHYSRTLRRVTRDADPTEIAAAWNELESQARTQLAADGLAPDQIRIRKSAALHYQGQSFDLVVPAPDGTIDEAYLSALAEAFGAEHERMYGHRASTHEPVELVSIQVLGIGIREGTGVPERVISSRPEPAVSKPRQVYFGKDLGWLETPIVRRSDLARSKPGPLIVEEYDATCVIVPGAMAVLDAGGNLVITLE